jgi:hypothetical protein
MKYPKLQEPCLSCKFKCFRVESPYFVKDENCRYRERKVEFKNIEGKQERIKI